MIHRATAATLLADVPRSTALSFSTIESAIDTVSSRFPFSGYMDSRDEAYRSIATHCATLLRAGSRVLDFGAGPCDTTAILSALGFRCSAIDDLSDGWHLIGDHRRTIRDFATVAGVDLMIANDVPQDIPDGSFDMVMLHDVIEHIADSPRTLLVRLIRTIKTGGYLYITVPNAANLRKRLLVLFGKTNYPRFPAYYWSGSHWRGHKREYVKDDLIQLCRYLGLARVHLRGEHHRLSALPNWLRGPYKATIGRVDSFRETLALIARKPDDWHEFKMSPESLRQIAQRETSFRYV